MAKHVLLGEPLATDTVVVIDVIRAFTTAVAAFEAGASAIYCVSGVEEALELGRELDAYVMGEDHGVAPEGFDFGNSPQGFPVLDGAIMVQRTSHGTQGLLAAVEAGVATIFAAAAVNATSTAVAAHAGGGEVTYLATHPLGEDAACGRYMVDGNAAAFAAALRNARTWHHEYLTANVSAARAGEVDADIAWCERIDVSPLVLAASPVTIGAISSAVLRCV